MQNRTHLGWSCKFITVELENHYMKLHVAYLTDLRRFCHKTVWCLDCKLTIYPGLCQSKLQPKRSSKVTCPLIWLWPACPETYIEKTENLISEGVPTLQFYGTLTIRNRGIISKLSKASDTCGWNSLVSLEWRTGLEKSRNRTQEEIVDHLTRWKTQIRTAHLGRQIEYIQDKIFWDLRTHSGKLKW